MGEGASRKALTARMAAHLAHGEFDQLRAAVGLPPEHAFTAIALLADAAPDDFDAEALIAGEGDAAGHVVAGAILHARSARARGAEVASETGEAQWNAYLPLRHAAREHLLAASAASPKLGVAAAWLMAASVDSGDDDKQRAETALLAAEGVPASGWGRLLRARTEKWGGSHDAMWQVARTHADRDPPGTLALIPMAHFEQQLWYAQFSDEPEDAARGDAYFQEPSVAAELAEASDRILAAPAADPYARLLADNWMAFVWFLAGEHRRAKPHLKRIGEDFDRAAWQLSAPIGTIRRVARRRAGFWF